MVESFVEDQYLHSRESLFPAVYVPAIHPPIDLSLGVSTRPSVTRLPFSKVKRIDPPSSQFASQLVVLSAATHAHTRSLGGR